MIGLVGAHRVGKTTLCMELLKGPYTEVPISISKMQQRMGYISSNQLYDWETRKLIQVGLLTEFSSILNTSKCATGILRMQKTATAISERTPLDLVGYLLINVPDQLTEEDSLWIKDYISSCIDLTNEYYERVFLVQPGIAYAHDDKSAGQETIDQLNTIYLSLLIDNRLSVERVIIPEEVTDLKERVQIVVGERNAKH